MRRINQLNLVGGYKLKEPWARGVFAVDWRTMTLKMCGNLQNTRLLTYDLASAGPPSGFPTVYPSEEGWGWWSDRRPGADHQYCNGLWYDGTNWWAVCRGHYDQNLRGEMDVLADDGTVWTVPLAEQKFSGFVKTPPDSNLIGWAYFGCGGYESGVGTSSGPTLADYLGNVFLDYEWHETPGANLERWNTRAPRLPDYWPEGHYDNWIGWDPRLVADVVQGRWASDWLFGGGVILPDGPLCYFPYQGTGELRYDWDNVPGPPFDQRSITFTEDNSYNRSSLLAYDPATYQCVEFDRLLGFGGPVGGQEVDPQGRLWLAQRYAHGDDYSEVQINVYEVTYA